MLFIFAKVILNEVSRDFLVRLRQNRKFRKKTKGKECQLIGSTFVEIRLEIEC